MPLKMCNNHIIHKVEGCKYPNHLGNYVSIIMCKNEQQAISKLLISCYLKKVMLYCPKVSLKTFGFGVFAQGWI